MILENNVVADVANAIKSRGFSYVGRASDGWLSFHGPLAAGGTTHACELTLDTAFFDLPRIQLLRLPTTVKSLTPHLGPDGRLCYAARGSIVLNIFDPVGQTLACIQRAEEVLDAVLAGKMIEDLEEEFYAHWRGPRCLVDVQGPRLGRLQCLVVTPDEDLTVAVTDDTARTDKKLKSLNRMASERTFPVFRIRSTARPRPSQMKWPPATVGQLLSWQGQLDPRCRRKIDQRLEEAHETAASGAVVLIDSPLLTYAFVALFDRNAIRDRSIRSRRVSMYASRVVPLTAVRIDDGYMAQRNVPGKKTLAGYRIALIGCGAIGGFLAEMLVKAGAGTSGGWVTLVDNQDLEPQNVGRHRLGFPHLFANKAQGLRDELQRLAPGVTLNALPKDVRMAQLGKIDVLIDATGEEALGNWLCREFVRQVPMLTSWVEGPGLAVRALLRTKSTGACYHCLCNQDRQGLFRAFHEGTPTVLAGHGCEELFVPFPASVSVQAAGLAMEMLIDWVNGQESPALRTRVIDRQRTLATSDCSPPASEDCPACAS